MNEHSQQESGLIIEVPEAEPLVGSFRLKHDPSAPLGVPAHITLLYPFMPPQKISDVVIQDLGSLLAEFSGFDCELIEIRRFPDVLYLHPAPAERFVKLTEAIFELFPDYPPYEGAFPEIIPHLTVAQVEDAEKLEGIDADFKALAGDQLPIRFRVERAGLMQKYAEDWQQTRHFSLKK